MLTKLLSNKKIWTILFTLFLLFAITTGLRYMGLYEGMTDSGTGENVVTKSDAVVADSGTVVADIEDTPNGKNMKIAKTYPF